jgi:hypothetical protein
MDERSHVLRVGRFQGEDIALVRKPPDPSTRTSIKSIVRKHQVMQRRVQIRSYLGKPAQIISLGVSYGGGDS